MTKGQAAWKIGDTVFAGRSHVEILGELTEAHRSGDLQHGYVDSAGRFYDNIEALFSSMKEIMIVRHAETDYNVGTTEYLDSGLTEKGSKQATGVAEYLKTSGDAAGFVGLVSPYLRTLQTAWRIHAMTGVQFKVFPLVAEYAAEWSRVPYDITVPVHQPWYTMFDWSLYQEAQRFTKESFNKFLDRMRKVLEHDLPDKTLIVSHGAVVYTLIDLLTGGGVLSDGYGQVTNASVSLIRGKEPAYLFKQEWKGD